MSKSSEIFGLLGTYKEMEEEVRSNLLLSPESLWSIFKHLPQDLNHEDFSEVSALQVAKAIVSHPNLAPEQVLFFLTHKKSCLKQKALAHKNFPEVILNEQVELCIKKKKINDLNKLCTNPNVNPNFVEKILKENLFTDKTINTLKYLCKYSSQNIQFEKLMKIKLPYTCNILFLKNPNANGEILNKLSEIYWHSPDFYKHPNLSPELKTKALNYVKKHLPDLYNSLSSQGEKNVA